MYYFFIAITAHFLIKTIWYYYSNIFTVCLNIKINMLFDGDENQFQFRKKKNSKS